MKNHATPNSAVGFRGARAIYSAFLEVSRAFDDITRRAHGRFEQRDWQGMQADAAERLEMTTKLISSAAKRLGELLGEQRADHDFWFATHGAYATRMAEGANPEIAQTFFNSVSRRLLGTVGLDEDIDFFTSEPLSLPAQVDRDLLHRHPWDDDVEGLVARLLDDMSLHAPFRQRSEDIRTVAQSVRCHLQQHPDIKPSAVEVLRPLFFRNKGAYLVGRLALPQGYAPFVLPLIHPEEGVGVDAALMDEDQISVVFSFTRSYFHVAVEQPGQIIAFLQSILPLKPVAELYIAIGHHKHGKTEMYRSMRRHLAASDDLFEIAAGARGMVMLVFTLPSYPIVFKVIRDKFDRPKTSTRRQVKERYELVFSRDRVGRLVDAQEFTRLRLPLKRFSRQLLCELLEEAGQTVHLDGEDVVLDHLYTERRMTPLNIFVREADSQQVHAAVIDYGLAIKELAAANIFPGDFLLKNFGVTRHGRVVFYDYDELCLVTDCHFRRMPPPRSPEEELDPETWFAVKPNDIFPEEFIRFLGLSSQWTQVFKQHHSELFTVSFWRDLQERHLQGELMDFFPYPRLLEERGEGQGRP